MVLLVAALLIASPLVGYWIVSSANVLNYGDVAIMGQADVPIIRDTFVSTTDSLDHSSDLAIRVCNITSGNNEVISITFIEFELVIPPAGSYLADLVLQLAFTEVLSGGSISFHKCASYVLEENVTYDDHPSYDIEPFANTTITQNGNVSISLHTRNGYTDWDGGGPTVFAITASEDTDVRFYSMEANSSWEPRMTLYSPVGIPRIENPFVFYLWPLSWVPVTVGFVLMGLMYHEFSRAPREEASTRNSDSS